MVNLKLLTQVSTSPPFQEAVFEVEFRKVLRYISCILALLFPHHSSTVHDAASVTDGRQLTKEINHLFSVEKIIKSTTSYELCC